MVTAGLSRSRMDFLWRGAPSVGHMRESLFVSGPDVPSYLRDVELLSAGLEWPASNGPTSITMEHIADAVRATSDPLICPPRIRLGHTSPLNDGEPQFDPFAAIGDAEPAFGTFTNLRTENDGAVLVADVDRILWWLAASAPATYPNRSSEAVWEVCGANFDVQSPSGGRYSMVITAVAFLGVALPAVEDLEDLSALIVNGPSALTSSAPAAAAALAAPEQGAAMSVSTATIRQRFNFDWAMDSDNGVEQNTYWWWARDIRVDDNEVIADDDEGNLWSVPFTTDGEDEVTFGEPARVRETYVPVAAAQNVVSFSRPTKPERPPAAAANAAESRPDPEGEDMDDRVREILEGQGLDPDTATEAQVTAAEQFATAFPQDPAATTTEPEGAAEGDDAPEGEATEQPEGEATTPAPEPVAAAAAPAASSLTIAVDRAQWEDTQREIQLSRQERRGREREQFDAQCSAAVLDGRIAPSVRAAWRAEIDPGDNPDATSLARAQAAQAALAALPAGRVPLDPQSVAPDPETDPMLSADELPDGVSLLNPAERRELRARRSA